MRIIAEGQVVGHEAGPDASEKVTSVLDGICDWLGVCLSSPNAKDRVCHGPRVSVHEHGYETTRLKMSNETKPDRVQILSMSSCIATIKPTGSRFQNGLKDIL